MLALTCAAICLAGCKIGQDAVPQAERPEKDRPTTAETKAIAEEGFVYGLPIVMNCAVMYEFCVHKESGQYEGPFNVISNDHRAFTCQDTTVVSPNSDTPCSMLWLDLRAEPVVATAPGVDKRRYHSVMMRGGLSLRPPERPMAAYGQAPVLLMISGVPPVA